MGRWKRRVCTPSKFLLPHWAASSIRELGPGGTAWMPWMGWTHVRRADWAQEGGQGALPIQGPGGSRERTISFAANKCKVRGLTRLRGLNIQAGGDGLRGGICKNQYHLELNELKLFGGF